MSNTDRNRSQITITNMKYAIVELQADSDKMTDWEMQRVQALSKALWRLVDDIDERLYPKDREEEDLT